MSTTDQAVGAATRRLREQAGETQSEIAGLLGVDQAAVSRLESGRRSVTARELVQLSEHFGVPAAAFLEPVEEAVLMRQGEAADEAVSEAADLFNRRIEAFFGARVWAP
ncbi:MAG TPA: helix-turn-helix transcriptional regulator [Miltoncostaeaceae bacterium]|nr:helix-turn-helix transcriptional regulator [Miltoncostaeaceae bacterium]